MRVITSFGGVPHGDCRHGYCRDYTKEVERLFDSARPYVDRCLFYDNAWLLGSVYNNPATARVMAEPSFGWMFKPVVIKEALATLSEGDLLLWVDSNDVVVKKPQPEWEHALQHQIFLHDHNPNVNPNKDWTHRDTFVRMGCDEPKYWLAPQVQVNVMVFQKTALSVAFVDEWVKHASDWDTMIGNVLPNHEGYQEHRHEQSICSLLAVKYGIPVKAGAPSTIIHQTGIQLASKA